MTSLLMSQEERGRAEKRARRRNIGYSYLFLLPYLILLAMFGAIPISYAFGLSFIDTIDYVFYGVANYEFVFSDFRIMRSLTNVVTFVGLWVTVTILGVVTLSLMLDNIGKRTAGTLRTLYFLPGAISSSALVVLWIFVLDPAVSPFQGIMHMFGWETLADTVFTIGMPAVFMLMAFFTGAGGWIVVFGGALSGISTDVVEAARVDGANRAQLALRIKLPLIWRSVILMGILSFAVGMQIFVEPQLMGMARGPFTMPDWSLNQMAYQYAFQMGDFGASAALSSLLVGFSISIALVVVFKTKFYDIG
jgi:multiple sugar transport system permease protein